MNVEPRYLPFEVKIEERYTANSANPQSVAVISLTLSPGSDKIIASEGCAAAYLRAQGYDVGACIQGCVVKNFVLNASKGQWVFEINIPEKKKSAKSVKKPSKSKSTRVNKTKEG